MDGISQFLYPVTIVHIQGLSDNFLECNSFFLLLKQELEIMMLSYALEKEEYFVERLRNQTANSSKKEVMKTLLNFSLNT
jgi:hypothetical protein